MPIRRSIAPPKRLVRARRLLPAVVAAAVVLSVACAKKPAQTASGTAPVPVAASAPAGALAAYAGHPLAVFPLQRVSGDSTGGADSLRARFDDAFASAARAAGVATGWAMAAELERSAKRNPGYVTDPRTLTVTGLAARRTDEAISGALGGELRSAVALHDARFAVVPFLLRLTGAAAERHAAVSLVVIDARLARVIGRAEVDGTGATDALATSAAAGRFAELFAAP